MGRPKLPADQKVKYQRVSIYWKTYLKIKELASKDKKPMAIWLDEKINKLK